MLDNNHKINNNNWKLCQKLGLNHGDRWYNHRIDSAIVTNNLRLLCDFPKQTDYRLEHNRPDIVLENEKHRMHVC